MSGLRSRNIWISAISALAAAVLVYAVYQLQLKHIELQETMEVIVPAEFVDAGVVLTESMLRSRPIPAGSVERGMLTSYSQAIGHETVIPLGKNEPILGWKLDRYSLLPRADEASFPIPKEYVLSVTGAVRAGDKVRLYTTGASKVSRRLFDRDVMVASVRNASNMELDDPKDPQLLARVSGDKHKLYLARRTANGMIDRVTLNLREQEWLELDQLCKEGGKLIVALTPLTAPAQEYGR